MLQQKFYVTVRADEMVLYSDGLNRMAMAESPGILTAFSRRDSKKPTLRKAQRTFGREDGYSQGTSSYAKGSSLLRVGFQVLNGLRAIWARPSRRRKKTELFGLNILIDPRKRSDGLERTFLHMLGVAQELTG